MAGHSYGLRQRPSTTVSTADSLTTSSTLVPTMTTTSTPTSKRNILLDWTNDVWSFNLYTIRSNTSCITVLASAKMSIHKNSREFPREFCERRIHGNSRTGIPGGLDSDFAHFSSFPRWPVFHWKTQIFLPPLFNTQFEIVPLALHPQNFVRKVRWYRANCSCKKFSLRPKA